MKFGITPEAALNAFGDRSGTKAWHPPSRRNKSPAPPAQPAAGSDRVSIADLFENYIRSKGPRTPEQLADELCVDLRMTTRILRKETPTRFQYRPGNLYGLHE